MPNQFTHRKYVFNINSVFINYLFLNERTRLLFIFRRLNGCHHKYSCIESIIRKMYQVISVYGLIRLPLYYILNSLKKEGNSHIMDSNGFICFEILSLLLVGSLRSAGCYARFMQEEII